MKFDFSCSDEHIVNAIAFGIDKNNNIQIAYGGKPMDTHDMTQIMGEAVREIFKKKEEQRR